MPDKPYNEMSQQEILVDTLGLIMGLMGDTANYMFSFEDTYIKSRAEIMLDLKKMIAIWHNKLKDKT